MGSQNIRSKSFSKLLLWIDNNGLKGYDPYDIRCHSNFTRSLYHDYLGLGIIGKVLSYSLFEILDLRVPLLLRRLLAVSKKEYATSNAHIAQALMYADHSRDRIDLILDKLWDKRLIKNGHPGWGLSFVWGTKERRFTPSVSLTVVNVWVGEAFLLAYDKFGDIEYLKKAQGIAQGIIDVCGYSDIEKDKICFHYSDQTQDKIHNANLLAASFLVKCHERSANNEYKTLAIKAVDFSLSCALNDGTLPYQSSDRVLHKKNDLYHCGYEIRSIYHIGKALDKVEYINFSKNYWNQVKNRLLDFEKPFYYRAERSRPIADTTSLAELILIETELELKDPSLISLIDHFLDAHQNADGSFIYQERNGLICRIPYIRWTQGWMALALGKNIFHESINLRQ